MAKRERNAYDRYLLFIEILDFQKNEAKKPKVSNEVLLKELRKIKKKQQITIYCNEK